VDAKKAKEREKQFYQEMGLFAIEFEHVCRSMEVCIKTILAKAGLKDNRIHEVILSGYTADPLRALLQNLVGQVMAINKSEKVICSKVFSMIQTIIKERNAILHGRWFGFIVDTGAENQFVAAIGEKLHANKHGASGGNRVLPRKALQDITEECQRAKGALSLLTRCAMGMRTLDECFQTDKGGGLIVKNDALRPTKSKM
jgi:hypothetical protein